MTKDNGPNQAPVDPGKLSVGQVVRNYPLAAILGIIGVLITSSGGAGYWLRDKFFSEELRHCQVEYRTLEKQAGTLQQAINSGLCVKSEFLAQQDEARRLLGRLDVANKAFELVRRGILGGQGVGLHSTLILLQADYWTSIDLGRFLEDAKVAQLVNEMSEITELVNDQIPSAWALARRMQEQREVIRDAEAKGQPPENIANYKNTLAAQENLMVETTKLMDQLQAALVRTREYLKSKYVMPAGP